MAPGTNPAVPPGAVSRSKTSPDLRCVFRQTVGSVL